ncbi:MAG: helix-turn-helix domain-containing protein [Paludibacter sp.]|nr:helix-turn-helix domain-containing protein [Bacteroidales bacterium]MCM1069835.1 helix-turn-helix domain-containing protein [Prevotella sp.]MCM1353971.1 helix-turn-helix domain-containing protein [Bacteroides sp.]MCM1443387.1 helix-turn-helix domain-containing protein [Muribaculum sp.]MCM1482090.1 helix-turn-helix domain-containing protein [Paludibacter sp.]
MAKKELEQNQRKELARMYYMQGDTQKEIAEKIGVSRNTISAWVRDGQWDSLRAAKTITRKELVNKMLLQIDEKLESKEWTADEISKAASAVEKLDKQTNIVTIIEVFTYYNQWLIARMNLDPELTPELVKTMNRYQDLFIGERLNSINITAAE